VSKKSVIARNKKRELTVLKYAERRAELKKKANDLNLSPAEQYAARLEIQKLPRDSSPVRVVRRCTLTGRPRGVLRKFKLSRHMLRLYAMQGDVPGIVKSSW
jgi:small subunit ribosomal protein S14